MKSLLVRSLVGLVVFTVVPVLQAEEPASEALELTENAKVVFADVKTGQKILQADDDFSTKLSRFDLQSKLQTDREVTREDWRKQVAETVTEWPAADKEKLKGIVASLKPKLAAFRLPLPKEILLIRTNGKDESNANYTRANAIVLPAAQLRNPPPALEGIFIHELFHVLSRHDATARAALYKIVGFSIEGEASIPKSLDDRRITNPDAPLLNCYIRLKNEEQEVTAVPILYAEPEKFDPKGNRTFFQYLTPRLLVVDKKEGKWHARLKDGRPVVLDQKKIESFYEQVGRNTNYTWHPDEILADNFIYLINKRQNLATPRVTEAMAEVLTK